MSLSIKDPDISTIILTMTVVILIPKTKEITSDLKK
jgi:hypothetical protein